MRKAFGTVLTTTVVLTSLVACGSVTGQSGYSIESALAQLPATDNTPTMVYTADLNAATEASGLERATELDSESIFDWIGPMTGAPSGAEEAPVFVPLATLFNPLRLSDHEEFAEELGWSLNDTDWFAERSTPPQVFTVAGAGFDEDSFAADLTDLGDGVVTNSDGEDLERDFDSSSVVGTGGAPLRLAESKGLIAAGSSTDEVAAWAGGLDKSLADDPALLSVSQALDDANVVSAVLMNGMEAATPGGAEATADELSSFGDVITMLPEDPFSAVGIGWAVKDDEGVITVAYSFDSDAEAKAAVPAFETLFSEGEVFSGEPLTRYFALQGAEQSGQTVAVTLTPMEGVPAHVIFDMLNRQDTPFVHQ